jgi:biotin-(acetyl-CoA carboxylase) ligase
MTKFKAQFKNETTLKQLLSHAEEQYEHYKDYGFMQDANYWQAKAQDYRAQLYALYHEREQFDKLAQI